MLWGKGRIKRHNHTDSVPLADFGTSNRKVAHLTYGGYQQAAGFVDEGIYN